MTFRGALWHGYSCSWTPAALCGEHLLTFFLPKVDIEWRNLCSIYSSNKAEHISEKIFQFYVVLWLSDVISFTLNVRHYCTSDRSKFSKIGKRSCIFLWNGRKCFKIGIIVFANLFWTIIWNYNEELRTTFFVKWNICSPRLTTPKAMTSFDNMANGKIVPCPVP